MADRNTSNGPKGAEPKNHDCATDQNEFLLVRGALRGIHKDGITTTNYPAIGRHIYGVPR